MNRTGILPVFPVITQAGVTGSSGFQTGIIRKSIGQGTFPERAANQDAYYCGAKHSGSLLCQLQISILILDTTAIPLSLAAFSLRAISEEVGQILSRIHKPNSSCVKKSDKCSGEHQYSY